MKVAVLSDIGKITIEERPIPEPHGDEVLIQVAYAGICGTDLSAFKTLSLPKGTIMGHEFSGTVQKTGDKAKKYQPGDRIVVRPASVCGECSWCKKGEIILCPSHLDQTPGLKKPGAYEQYVLVNEYQVYPLPEQITFQQAAQLEPLAVGVGSLSSADVKLGDRILIIGAGPIGLMIFQCLKLTGASEIVIVEKTKRRRDKARELGAQIVLDNAAGVKNIVANYPRKGFDVVFECAGKEETIQLSLDFAAKGSKVIFVGVSSQPVKINHFNMVFKGLAVRAHLGYTINDWDVAWELLKSGKIEVDSLVTKIYPLEEIEQGFRDLINPEGAIKVLIKPN